MSKEKTSKDLEKEAEAAAAHSGNYFTPKVKVSRSKTLLLMLVEAMALAAFYTNYDLIKLQIHPLAAPVLLGSATAALAQTFNQYTKSQLSYSRLSKFLVWGAINGMFTALWIDLVVRSTDNVVYRVLFDQLVGAPCFQLLFNVLNSLWEHGEITSTTRLSFFKSLRYSYCFWPFFSILGFGFLDPEFMFPANCLGTLLWNVILSKLA
ncbi:hypothetical protein DICA4_E32000 [Diutina catenulata]